MVCVFSCVCVFVCLCVFVLNVYVWFVFGLSSDVVWFVVCACLFLCARFCVISLCTVFVCCGCDVLRGVALFLFVCVVVLCACALVCCCLWNKMYVFRL